MNLLTIDDTEFDIPSEWNELNKEQLINIIKAISNIKDVIQLRVKIVFILLEVHKSFHLQMFFRYKYKLVDAERNYIDPITLSALELSQQEASMYQLLNEYFFPLTYWIIPEGNNEISKLTLTKNLIPKIGKLYGPKDGLSNLRFYEFVVAEKYYKRYLNTNKESYLDELIAVLYRPAKWTLQIWYEMNLSEEGFSDIRKPFEDYSISKRIKRISKLDKAVKQAVLIFYESSKAAFAPQYPFLFKKSEEKEKATASAWYMALDQMAGTVYNYKQVAKVELFVALFHLNRTIEKNEKLKQKS